MHLYAGSAFAQGPQLWESRADWNCTGAGAGGSLGTAAEDVATIQGFGCLVANVLSVAITGIGLVAFVMFIYGAFRYMLSGGQEQSVKIARSSITYAVVGIVVALSSFVILNLITAFTGVNVTEFIIPQATVTPQ